MISISSLTVEAANAWKKRAPYVGVGIMILWGLGLICVIPWTKSYQTSQVVLGSLGFLIVTIASLATFFYIDFLEGYVKDLANEIRVLNEILEDERSKIRRQSKC